MQQITRRNMLKRSAGSAVVASGVVTLATPTYGRIGANEEIQIGVIGFNGQGRSHIKGHQSAPGVRVSALCDVDERIWGKGEKALEGAGGSHPKFYHDMRELFENKAIDAVSIATPNHWHALATIWACQAGKDVYVEKPGSWCVVEGRRMVQAARKYGRMVQHGSQSRSDGKVREAIARLHADAIGKVYMARGLCYKPGTPGGKNTRGDLGFRKTEPAPHGLHFDTWLGPAPKQPYHGNLVHYRWHWFWDFGNGDMGNQGIHQMDIARWGLGQKLPVQVTASGGRFANNDQGETPNVMTCSYTYEDGSQLVFETRGLPSNEEGGAKIGNLFYGTKGWLSSGDGWKPRLGDGDQEMSDDALAKLHLDPVGGSGTGPHMRNFHEAIRSRKKENLNADILEGHFSCVHVHLGNIAYRLGRTLKFDPATERFVGDDQANAMLTRAPRPPFVVPETPTAV